MEEEEEIDNKIRDSINKRIENYKHTGIKLLNYLNQPQSDKQIEKGKT